MANSAEDAQGHALLRAAFHYQDGEREARTNLLLQHLQLGERVVVLEGDTGAGRTHLLRRILARQDHGLRFYAVHAEPGLTATDLLLGLLEQFEHPPAPSDNPERIRSYAAERVSAMIRNGESPVLALDDAENLDAEVLDSLLAFRTEAREPESRCMGMLLVGSRRLALGIAERQEHDQTRPPVAVSLYGFEPAATRAFLAQALKADGDEQGLLLETLDIDIVHSRSGGRPGAILDAARKQLAQPAGTTRRARPRAAGLPPWLRLPSGSRRSIALVSAGTVAVIGTLLAMTWVLDDDDPLDGNGEVFETTEITAAEPETDEPEDTDQDTVETLGSATQRDEDDAGQDAIDTSGEYDFSSEEPDDEFGDIEPPDEEIVQTPSIQELVAAAAESGEANGDPEPNGADTEVDAETEAQEEQPAGTAEGTDTDESADDDAADATDTAPDEDQSPLAQALESGQAWREAQSGNDWTVQLVAAHSPETVLGWLTSNTTDEPDGLHLLVTERDGDDWYVVVTGAMPDREAARDHMQAVLQDVDAEGAWLRQLDGL